MYETQYIELGNAILDHGQKSVCRNDHTTVSVFAPGAIVVDLQQEFPVLTTRKVRLDTVFKELMFFIRGQTDTKILENQGVGIWKGNTNRAFLDSRGLQRFKEGDMGPMYGFAMRHFGATYHGCDHDYRSGEWQGVDQLSNIINLVQNDPTSRRMVVTMYDPSVLDQCVLMPCHMFWQVYVRGEYLDMVVYQRSVDFTCGLSFNTPSYAMLLVMLAGTTGKKPGILKHSFGDTHVYTDHIPQLKQQLWIEPAEESVRLVGFTPRENIEDYTFDDFVFSEYTPKSNIRYTMKA